MLWKSPGLAVEEVDLLPAAPAFQTRSKVVGCASLWRFESHCQIRRRQRTAAVSPSDGVSVIFVGHR